MIVTLRKASKVARAKPGRHRAKPVAPHAAKASKVLESRGVSAAKASKASRQAQQDGAAEVLLRHRFRRFEARRGPTGARFAEFFGTRGWSRSRA